ncbi:hypothetical protein [Demequina lutea]|uniref:Uncharacterized protein n=1 Tax=Demequina lutea TaxID=431489 RepID=A0A7Z0CJV3_9MICO|nr:hypothetical protein [Demequina lutea]NYI41177.1 hypothetical protein [Demequina lutea]
MKALRTFVSAIAILAGAALVVAWCGAWLLLSAVDDGVVARTMVQTALATPAVTARIGDDLMSRTTESLSGLGIDLTAIGADGAVRTALVKWTQSDDFKQTVLDQVDAAREKLHEELASRDRPQGPFTVSINVSATVNKRLGEIPVVGSQIPNVAVAPVQVELVSADSFNKARTAYSRLEFAKRYFLWIGGALIVVGLLVSTRRRYVIAKFLIAVGAMALGLVVIVTVATPERLASGLPGGDQGTWGQLAIQAFSDAALPAMRRTIAIIGAVAIAAGALMVMILKSFSSARR